jgi:hypothetical protein
MLNNQQVLQFVHDLQYLTCARRTPRTHKDQSLPTCSCLEPRAPGDGATAPAPASEAVAVRCWDDVADKQVVPGMPADATVSMRTAPISTTDSNVLPHAQHLLASINLRCWQHMATCIKRGIAGSAAPRSVYCMAGCCAAAASCASCMHLLRKLDSTMPPCRRDSSDTCRTDARHVQTLSLYSYDRISSILMRHKRQDRCVFCDGWVHVVAAQAAQADYMYGRNIVNVRLRLCWCDSNSWSRRERDGMLQHSTQLSCGHK